MNRDGSGSRSLSDKLDRDVQDPQWAPDNTGVYFRYDDQGDTKIGFYSVVDGAFKKIADHLASTTGAGGSGTFSLSRTGMLALTYRRPDNPGDIAISNLRALKVLTSLNQELLAQNKPGHREEISFESSKDNRKIQGWVVHPPDFDPAKQYPLVLEIHDGPFPHHGDRFYLARQRL